MNTTVSRTPISSASAAAVAHRTRVLLAAADAATEAWEKAWTTHSRSELAADVGLGGDGTPTSRLDEIVDQAVLGTVASYGVNVLSEEVGWIDRGSAMTLAVDPIDGTANALAGVPVFTFSAALVEDGHPVAALTRWFDGGQDWLVAGSEVTQGWKTTGRRRLRGAAVSLLRPQRTTKEAWWAVSEPAGRIRIFSCSTFEAVLVCRGASDAFVDAGGDVHRYVDLVAAQLYAKVAGAVVTDAKGRAFEFDTDLTRRWSGIVAASPQLAEEIKVALAPHL